MNPEHGPRTEVPDFTNPELKFCVFLVNYVVLILALAICFAFVDGNEFLFVFMVFGSARSRLARFLRTTTLCPKTRKIGKSCCRQMGGRQQVLHLEVNTFCTNGSSLERPEGLNKYNSVRLRFQSHKLFEGIRTGDD